MTRARIPISTERPANKVSDMSKKPSFASEADRATIAEEYDAASGKPDGVVTALTDKRGMI
jgi:hypothetical protein